MIIFNILTVFIIIVSIVDSFIQLNYLLLLSLLLLLITTNVILLTLDLIEQQHQFF